jgi:hypothetical protein
VPVTSLTVTEVGAGEGVDVDRLDAAEVHHDVAEVWVKCTRSPLAVAAMISLPDAPLRPWCRPAAVDDIGTVARIPHEGVVALTQEGGVDTAVAVATSLPRPPKNTSLPLPPMNVSSPFWPRPPFVWCR